MDHLTEPSLVDRCVRYIRLSALAIVISLVAIALNGYIAWRHFHPPEPPYAGGPQTYPWTPKLVYHPPRTLTPQEWQDTMDEMCRRDGACYPESMRVAPSKPESLTWPDRPGLTRHQYVP